MFHATICTDPHAPPPLVPCTQLVQAQQQLTEQLEAARADAERLVKDQADLLSLKELSDKEVAKLANELAAVSTHTYPGYMHAAIPYGNGQHKGWKGNMRWKVLCGRLLEYHISQSPGARIN